MDTYRAFLAILISFLILIGYQYFFVGFQTEQPVAEGEQAQQPGQSSQQATQQPSTTQLPQTVPMQPSVTGAPPAMNQEQASRITVDTDLFTAVISEAGGAIKSFVLKNHTETSAEDSPGKQLVENAPQLGYPMKFSWGSVVPADIYYKLENGNVTFVDGRGELRMSAVAPSGLKVEKTYVFSKDNYLMDLAVRVSNPTSQSLQGNPQLTQVNVPFQESSAFNRFLFSGPAAYINNQLKEYETKEFEDGPKTVQGIFDWVAYEGTYFMCAIIPQEKSQATFTMQGSEDYAYTQYAGTLDTLSPGEAKVYNYRVFYGPKKLSLLQEIGFNLDKSIDFGWFDFIAKPTLWLLNYFHSYVKNYGIAIILVTIIFKALFWPITQKGLKSMKNMQKLQPKMLKLKEKYKNDPQAMNREVMNLYKTYKVNPLGGCLPMLLQIPVFFALYKVLLLCIELRHAPFMLWINDLSAPDRLWIGFEIPWLGGLPVLTLLMGASMFLQQKMTPTTADPTQAKIMMMLPVFFTFMFVNFASGLVLYWFTNNLLSILQQQLINRSAAKTA
ncbi:MAG: membrane protein insertase YidC [Desulfocapsaceae bacterium]|nr:membrane protein insertase YidC [Desulfocapsaceae bacterium]